MQENQNIAGAAGNDQATDRKLVPHQSPAAEFVREALAWPPQGPGRPAWENFIQRSLVLVPQNATGITPDEALLDRLCRLDDAGISSAEWTQWLKEADELNAGRKLGQVREVLADDVFEAYQFGDDVTVEQHDNWDANDPLDLTKIVFVSYDDDPTDSDTHKISFHVRFAEDGAIEDAYALDMDSGNDIGCRGDITAEQAVHAAALAFESAKDRWTARIEAGQSTECLIESTDVFYALSQLSLPCSDFAEKMVENALSSQGFYAQAADAFKAYQFDADQKSDRNLDQVREVRLDFHWADGADTSFIGVYETTLEGYESGDLPSEGDFIQLAFGDDAQEGKAIEQIVQSAVDAGNAVHPKTRAEAISAAVAYLETQTGESAHKVFAAFAAENRNLDTNPFDRLFADAIEGLREYYPLLLKSTISVFVVDGLKQITSAEFVNTGNDQLDYEWIRDRIEKQLSADADVVLDDIRDSVRRIQSGGHGNPKSARNLVEEK